MFRLCVATIVVICTAACVSAQEWADKMFLTRSHDFGPVARAAKVEYRFVLKNRYKEDIHIASVRSSCGCTVPRIEKETLKTYEEGAIVAAFNTRAFTGQRRAHVTVTIDQPYYAEVQLEVRGYIRTDIVVDPPQVALGSVDQGSPSERTVNIEYAGRDDWRILDAKSNSPYLKTEVIERGRGNGRVSYRLKVKLDEKAPAGYINDELQLVTNDYRATKFPVVVEGRVVSALAVSPSSLMLGILQPGQKVTKQIILKAKKPFRVLDVKADQDGFTFSAADEPKTVQVVRITYEAASKPGKLAPQIQIKTDLADHNQATLTAYGQITSPLAGR